MNTIGGILLCMLAGAIVWALVRFFSPIPTYKWGIRGFWIVCVVALMSSTQAQDPLNIALMGIFGGAMVFEYLCQKYGSKFKIPQALKGDREKGAAPRKKRRTTKPKDQRGSGTKPPGKAEG